MTSRERADLTTVGGETAGAPAGLTWRVVGGEGGGFWVVMGGRRGKKENWMEMEELMGGPESGMGYRA